MEARRMIGLSDVSESILETSSNKEKRPILVNKIRCRNGDAGVVFFAMDGDPPKGYAMLILDQGSRDTGTLHVFDAWGIKRKILSNIRMPEIESFSDSYLYEPEIARTSVIRAETVTK